MNNGSAAVEAFQKGQYGTQGGSEFMGDSGNEIGPELDVRHFVRNCTVQKQSAKHSDQKNGCIRNDVAAKTGARIVLGTERDMEEREVIQAHYVLACKRRLAGFVDL